MTAERCSSSPRPTKPSAEKGWRASSAAAQRLQFPLESNCLFPAHLQTHPPPLLSQEVGQHRPLSIPFSCRIARRSLSPATSAHFSNIRWQTINLNTVSQLLAALVLYRIRPVRRLLTQGNGKGLLDEWARAGSDSGGRSSVMLVASCAVVGLGRVHSRTEAHILRVLEPLVTARRRFRSCRS